MLAPQLCAAAADEVSKGDLFDLLMEATSDGVMDWNVLAKTASYSPRWKMLLGYEESDLVETPELWIELTHPDDLPRVREVLAEHLDSFWPFSHSFRMRHGTGEWRWILCRAVTVRDDNAAPVRVVAVFGDITERVRAEERLRALASAIPDLLLRVRLDGMLLDFKPADANHGIGVEPPAVGQPLAVWGPAHSWLETGFSAIRTSIETAKTGSFEASMTLGTGAVRQAEVRVVRSGDDEAVLIIRDVTDERRREGQLMQSRKLEAIGQLAAGVAHEINTPMQYVGDNLSFLDEAIRGLIGLWKASREVFDAAQGRAVLDEEMARITALEEELDAPYVADAAPRSLERALEGVERVSNIVRAMKEFSHPGAGTRDPCELNRQVETTVTVAGNVWRYVAEIERKLDPTLPPVHCHRGEINQVILNLLVNAADAISDVVGTSGDKGKITVATARVGDFVELRISDTGTGIPEAVRHRIFDPFFTTKDVGRGTGQGLPLARSIIVEKHGGTIDFETEVGRGTTFIVRLPLGAGS
jgi:PAS domain S-box-containing protein